MKDSPPSSQPPKAGLPSLFQNRKVVIGLGCVLAAVLLVGAAAMMGGGGTDQLMLFHTVQQGDLAITVTERGNLESQDQIEVRCEVDDLEGDQIHGTPILFIVPNGAVVEEGDLLVELDSSGLRERLDRQILDTDRARSEQIQAKVKFENQQTQNETNLAEAQLKVELAELALKQFEDEEGGTFQIELQDIEGLIQEAQASKLIEATNLEGVTQLYQLGYRSRGELSQAQLSSLRSERQLATAISKKKELVEYSYRKQRLQLEGELASAKRAKQQVERDNHALLEQAKAELEEQDKAFKKEEERLTRYRTQLDKCKIYSPAPGMVAYATERNRRWYSEIREGNAVRLRQRLMTIPNLKKMQVKTSVHESVLDQIRPGLPVTVRSDAFPDKSYLGSVRYVAVLPDQDSSFGPDTKVYETLVTIDEEVSQIKPGMTAVVEIHVAYLENVLTVPVTAIVQVGKESWCLVDDSGVERRTVKLGASNDKFVEVKSGLEKGERVVLNPDRVLQQMGISLPEDDSTDEKANFRRPTPVNENAAPADRRGGRDPSTGPQKKRGRDADASGDSARGRDRSGGGDDGGARSRRSEGSRSDGARRGRGGGGGGRPGGTRGGGSGDGRGR